MKVKIILFCLITIIPLSGQESKVSNFVFLHKSQTIPKKILNDTLSGVDFVYIPAGTFTMGEGSESHKVSLTKEFYLGKFEVTQGQWKKMMGSNPSHFQGDKCKLPLPKGCEDNPVERVSWADIQAYLTKLNQKAKNAEKAYQYRLPTEAEWEYAARAGSTTKYYWGEEANGDYAWYSSNSESKTQPVGTRKPNGFGLYDMSGNVWEWCSDWHDGSEYEKREKLGDIINPKGPATGEYRVLRGGSWLNNDYNMRSSYRDGGRPYDRYNDIGFRLLLSISE